MVANVSAFSFKNLNVSYGGIPISGFMKGDDAVMVEANTDLINTIIGPDGSGTFNQIADRSATLTLKLLDTSPSNDVLAAFYTTLAAGVFIGAPLIISDTYGTTVATGYFAVKSMPTIKYGENMTGREWKLETVALAVFPGHVGKPVTV